MTTQRLAPEDREKAILEAALRVAERAGYNRVTRESIATEAGVSPGLVSARLGTMVETRRKIMRAAIRDNNLKVLAQGLAARDPYAMRAHPDLRARAAKSLA